MMIPKTSQTRKFFLPVVRYNQVGYGKNKHLPAIPDPASRWNHPDQLVRFERLLVQHTADAGDGTTLRHPLSHP